MFTLLDCFWKICEDILAHIQTGEEGQAGHCWGDVTQLIVSQVQLLQPMTVEQGSAKIHSISLVSVNKQINTLELIWF